MRENYLNFIAKRKKNTFYYHQLRIFFSWVFNAFFLEFEQAIWWEWQTKEQIQKYFDIFLFLFFHMF